MSWWHEPFALFQTNIRRIDAGLDTESTADFLSELGYDVWMLNAGGIYSFYPVNRGDQEPSPTLSERASGDLIGDALASCRARGIRLVARFDFSRIPEGRLGRWAGSAHLSSSGDRTVDDGLVNLCPRSDYYVIRGREVIKDFVTRYDVDGVFFNWMQFPVVTYRRGAPGACHCDRCLAAWSNAYPGRAYPASRVDDGFNDLFRLNMAYLQGLAETFAQDVKAIRPSAALFLADARVDMVFLEINSFLGATSWWEHTPSEMASVHRTARPDIPAMVHAANNIGLPYRQVPEQPAQFARYAIQGIARGARPATVIVGPPTKEHFASWGAIPEVLAVYRDNRALYNVLEPAADVALLRPEGGGVASLGSTGDSDGSAEYRGIFSALQRRHVPFDVLGVEYGADLIGSRVLENYRVIVVPGGVPLGPYWKAALADRIRSGLQVVLTGDPRVLDDALELPTSVEEVFVGESDLGGRFGFRKDGAFGDRVPVLGALWGMQSGSQNEDGWALSEQAPPGPPEITHGNELPTAYDLAVARPVGNGRLVNVPWTIGETHQLSGLGSVADFIATVVTEAAGDSAPIRVQAPECVEVIVGRSDAALVLHLINHSGGRPDRVADPIPVQVAVAVNRGMSVRSLQGVAIRPQGQAEVDGWQWFEMTVDGFEVLVVA